MSSGTDTSTLTTSPPTSAYLPDMTLGTAVDAITGQVTATAIATGFGSVKEMPDHETTLSLGVVEEASKTETTSAIGLSASVTFPVDGVDVGIKNAFDFSNTSTATGSTIFIVLNWERKGISHKMDMNPAPQLSDAAKKYLSTNKAAFRNKYGDYFVSEVLSRAKFTAVWYSIHNDVPY